MGVKKGLENVSVGDLITKGCCRCLGDGVGIKRIGLIEIFGERRELEERKS